MEPITLIVTALSAGAALIAQKSGEELIKNGVKDLYDALKSRIKQKFAGQPTAEMVLQEHEQAPQDWEAPLKQKLTQAGAAQDQELQKLAEELLKKVDPEGEATGKYRIHIEGGVTASQMGDGNTGTFNVGVPPTPPPAPKTGGEGQTSAG